MSAERTTPIVGETRDERLRRRALALTAAIVCHGTFVVAIAHMFTGLACGLASGRGRLDGAAAWIANTALALQFPLLHSALLTARGRSLLARSLGARHGRTLVPTAYAWIAALQVLATFVLWSPSGTLWWEPSGRLGNAVHAVNLAAWMLLGKALVDGGLGLQTGWTGWRALWRGRPAPTPELRQSGLFAACRQPIYAAFALTLWSAPRWTPDHLLLAGLWSAYCLVGPLRKERRYARWYGEEFARYRRHVPYMLPRARKSA